MASPRGIQCLPLRPSLPHHILSKPPRRPLSTSRPLHQDPPRPPPRPRLPDPSQAPPSPNPHLLSSGAPDLRAPLVHTLSIFSRLFRYSVYGSVIIVLGVGSTWWFGNEWIERVELKGPVVHVVGDGELDDQEDDYWGWKEEFPYWSGIGKIYRSKSEIVDTSGTDPRMGFFARLAVRSAYMSQNYDSTPGSFDSAVSRPTDPSLPSATTTPSPFSPTVGFIPSQPIRPTGLRASSTVLDRGYEDAEVYLLHAIERAEKKGINVQSVDGRIDRSALSIQERLAGVGERAGGVRGLEVAKQRYRNIFESLSTSPTSSSTPYDRWLQREKIRLAKKIGEVSLRLADEFDVKLPNGKRKKGMRANRDYERDEGERWLNWAVGASLGVSSGVALESGRVGGGEGMRLREEDESSGSKGLFGWFSRPTSKSETAPTTDLPQPTTSPASQQSSLPAILAALKSAVTSPSGTTVDPPTTRALISSLISLSLLQVKKKDYATAMSLQTSALELTDSSLSRPSSSPSAAERLHRSWIITRSSLLKAYLAELIASNKLPSSSPSPQSESLSLLQSALSDLESPQEGPLSPVQKLAPIQKTFFDKLRYDFFKFSSPPPPASSQGEWTGPESSELERARMEIWRDASKTAGLAANTAGLLHEIGCGGNGGIRRSKTKSKKGAESSKSWCGGDPTALQFYESASLFSSNPPSYTSPRSREERRDLESVQDRVGPGMDVVDSVGFGEYWDNYRRVRERVMKREEKRRERKLKEKENAKKE